MCGILCTVYLGFCSRASGGNDRAAFNNAPMPVYCKAYDKRRIHFAEPHGIEKQFFTDPAQRD